ncbi:hypothetical protein G4V62_14255 [Bacillaceae bacterium SIJ1]|uniref:hypothetical protein n=1 Tax=Litoribacterium kuwaitense TaxID=1398745 RepID=UPI0013EDE8E3|nr:hypothetical protein [Litoribacterium kuwaitense]NGP46056.1 hypothetical protein [Litoribacterium kuwaitense]
MKTNATGFLLAIIAPGLGHLVLRKRGRAFLYFSAFFMCLAISGFIFFIEGLFGIYTTEVPFINLLVFIAVVIWLISVIDYIFTMLRTNSLTNDHDVYSEAETIETKQKQPAGSLEMREIGNDFVPGISHFALGMYYRGLSVLLALGVSLFMIAVFVALGGMTWLPFLFIISVFLFAAADARDMRKRMVEGEDLDDRILFAKPRPRQKEAALVLLFFPGLGHYYLGQKNKGKEAALVFGLLLFLSTFPNLNMTNFLAIFFWVYMAIDLSRTIEKLRDGKSLDDTPILGMKWLGWLILLCGALYMWDMVLWSNLIAINDNYWIEQILYEYWYIKDPLLIAGALIVLGIC